MDEMGRLAAAPDLPPRDQVFLQFSLGKAFEDEENYDRAIEHFTRGNALHRASIDYNADQNTMEFERQKSVLTRNFSKSAAERVVRQTPPIFIVGLPRSGSNSVEQILSSHSAIEGTRKLPNIQGLAASLLGKFPIRFALSKPLRSARWEKPISKIRASFESSGGRFLPTRCPAILPTPGWNPPDFAQCEDHRCAAPSASIVVSPISSRFFRGPSGPATA